MLLGTDVPLFTVRADLPTGGNRKRMGTAIWLWLWLTNKQTSEDGTVWYGRPLSPSEIARDLEFDDARNVRRLFARLVAEGYVSLRQTAAGPVVRICHPSKRFKAKTLAMVAAAGRTEMSASEAGAGTSGAVADPPNRPQAVENTPTQDTGRTKMSACSPSGPAARSELAAPAPVGGAGRTEMSGGADKNVRGHYKDRARVRKEPLKQPQKLDSNLMNSTELASIVPRPPGRTEDLMAISGFSGDIADWVSPERAFFLEVLAAVAPGHDERLAGLIEARARERDPAVRCLDLAALLAVARPENYRVDGHGFWPVAVANLMSGDVYQAITAARRAGYSRWSLEGGRGPRVRKALRVIADFGPGKITAPADARQEAVG